MSDTVKTAPSHDEALARYRALCVTERMTPHRVTGSRTTNEGGENPYRILFRGDEAIASVGDFVRPYVMHEVDWA